MGALTVRMLEKIARFELGAQPDGPLEMRELVNQAGEHLVAMWPWRWLEGRQARLRPRAQIELTGATWTEATKTITLAGAFTDYSLLSADTLEVLSGTGAIAGTYEVLTRPTANTVTLATSISSAAVNLTGIEAVMRNDQIALPSDFDLAGITAYAMKDGLAGDMRFTTDQGMLNLRSYPTVGVLTGFWALLRYVRGVSGGQAVKRLELWPATDDSDEEMVIFYRGGWKEPATDDEVLSPPSWMNPLFIEVFKAVVMGHEESETGSLDARLTALNSGILFYKAKSRDLLEQVEHGRPTNTWLDAVDEPLSRFSVPPLPATGP